MSALAAVSLAALAGLAASPVSAAPGDAYSFHVEGSGSFLAQSGTTETRVFTLVNDGTESLIFAAAPALGAPLHVDSSTSMSGETVTPGASATFTVTFTAGVAGTTTTETVMLYAADTTATSTVGRPLTLTTTSTATPPLHFMLDPVSLAFGSVTVGASATQQFTITNDGSVTLRFCPSDITVRDISASIIPGFRVARASWGTGCGFIAVGGTESVDLVYTPSMSTEAFSAVLHVDGYFVNGDVVSKAIPGEGTVTARAVDPVIVVPSPSTAPVPSAPAGLVVPTGAKPAGAAASQQLAHTGAQPAFGIGFAALTVALGAIAFSVAMVARRKTRRG